MILNKNNRILYLSIILLVIIFIGSIFMNNQENFQDVEDSSMARPSESNDVIEETLLKKYNDDLKTKSNSELIDLASRLRLRLDSYGLFPDGSAPDMSKFVTKSELQPDMGKCTVDRAYDKSKYILKAAVPEPGPKIDLSKYVLKSSIPPEKVCPPQKEIDYSKYVLKSTIPPQQKCPPCICPKVKVEAGLCKQCPPPPKCPPPEACPVSKCPEPKPCPEQAKCPHPEPCPISKEKVRYDVKYIKVPTVITVDKNGKIISKVTGSPNNNNNKKKNNNDKGMLGGMFSSSLNSGLDQNSDNENNKKFENNGSGDKVTEQWNLANSGYDYTNPELNTAFKKHGIYGSPY